MDGSGADRDEAESTTSEEPAPSRRPAARFFDYFVVVNTEPGCAQEQGPPASSSGPATDGNHLTVDADTTRDRDGDGEPAPSEAGAASASAHVCSLQPVLSSRLPLVDHSDVEMPLGLEGFCQPSGARFSNEFRPPTFITPFFTTVDGERLYCGVLTFDVPVTPPSGAPSGDEDGGQAAPAPQQYRPMSIACVSRFPFFDAFRSFLCATHSVWGQAGAVEQLVAHAMHGVPVPDVGAPRVEASFGAAFATVGLERPAPTALSFPRGVVTTLFSVLDIGNVLTLLTAVLLEEKLVLMSSSHTVLVSAFEAIAQLIYPLEYPFVFIPILPGHLTDFLAAPTAFIMGIVSGKAELDIPEDVFQVDLDNNHITLPAEPGHDLTPLPIIEGGDLRNGLRTLLRPQLALADLASPPAHPLSAIVDASCRATTASLRAQAGIGVGNIAAFERQPSGSGPDSLNSSRRGKINQHEELDEDSKETALRWLFLRFFTSILSSYRGFFRTVRVNPDFEVLFNHAAFISTRRRKLSHALQIEAPQDSFVVQLLRTSAFSRFCRSQSSPGHVETLFDQLVEDVVGSFSFPHPRALHEKCAESGAEVTRVPCPKQLSEISALVPNMRDGPTDAAAAVAHLDGDSFERACAGRGTSDDADAALEDCLRAKARPSRSSQRRDGCTSGDELSPEQRQLLEQCLAALSESEESMMNWYIDAFDTFHEELKAEALSYELAVALCDVCSTSKALSIRRFEVVSRLVESMLAHDPCRAGSPGELAVDRVAGTLLPLIVSCYTSVANSRKYVYHQVSSFPLWKDTLFWESFFVSTMQQKLMELYQVESPAELQQLQVTAVEEQEKLDAEEERVVFQQVGVVMRHQTMLDVLEADIRRFVEKASQRVGLGHNRIDVLLTSLAPQVAFQHDLALAVYRKHPSKSVLPKLQSGGRGSTSHPYFLPSEIQIEAFEDILYLTAAEQHEDRLFRYARGSIFVTNYRLIFQGTWKDPPIHVQLGVDRPRGVPGEEQAEDDRGLRIVRGMPLAAVQRINWFTLHADMHPSMADWAQEGLAVRSRSFQMFRLLVNLDAAHTLSQIQASLSRLVFYNSVQDTFALFTSTKHTVSGQQRNTKMSDAVRRALQHQASVRSHGSMGAPRRMNSQRSHQGTEDILEETEGSNGSEGSDGEGEEAPTPTPLQQANAVLRILPEEALHNRPLFSPLRVESENVHSMRLDWKRQGVLARPRSSMTSRVWRVSQANSEFKLCDTYPTAVCVPASLNDRQLIGLAHAFVKDRFPCLAWTTEKSSLLRSSALRSDGVCNDEDRVLLRAIARTAAAKQREGPLTRSASIGERPSRLSSSPRRHSFSDPDEGPAAGRKNFIITQQASDNWNIESSFDASTWEHLHVDSEPEVTMQLGAVKRSADLLVKACTELDEDGFYKAVGDSHWYNQVSALLHWAAIIADLLRLQESTVLVSLEEGRDQTAQLVSLAQILIDPYYRTLEGLQALIRKEWLGMGHKFGSRSGLNNSLGHEQAPVFVQFLDAVYQLTVQFPLEFEYNGHFLATLAHHTTSMRFGTFLHDDERQREALRKEVSTNSFWAFIDNCNDRSPQYYNFMFSPSSTDSNLRPVCLLASLRLWTYCYVDATERDALAFDAPLTAGTLGGVHEHISSLLQAKLDASDECDDSACWQAMYDEANTEAERRARLSQDIVAQPEDGRFARLSRGQSFYRKRNVPAALKGKLSWQADFEFMHPHRFTQQKATHAICYHCEKKMTKTEFYCSDCGIACHERCAQLVPRNCGQVKEEEPPTPTSSGRSVMRKRLLTFATVDTRVAEPLDQEAMTGLLYKVGARVKNWKLRWFFLDVQYMQLRYYRPPKNSELRGSINLRKVSKLRERNEHNKHVAAFLEVFTPSRIYVLRAATTDERREWINALAATVRDCEVVRLDDASVV